MKYIRDIVFTQWMLGVSYIHTSKNIADVMTKATEMVITFDFFNFKRKKILRKTSRIEINFYVLLAIEQVFQTNFARHRWNIFIITSRMEIQVLENRQRTLFYLRNSKHKTLDLQL